MDNIKIFITMLLIFYIILTILIYKFFCKRCGIIDNSNNLKKYNSATVNQENFIGVSSLLLTLVGNNNINKIVNDNITNNYSKVNNDIKVDKISKNP